MMLEVAAVTGDADLVVGLVLGLCIGLLVAPAFRAWQSRREWVEASREAQLADRLLHHLESGSDRVDMDPAAFWTDHSAERDERPLRGRWRTHR